MFSGIIRQLPAALTAVALLSAALLPGDIAAADPDQDQKFFDLLGQKEIPPVDNATSLITSAHKVCDKLDDGVPVGDIVETIRNNGFNENPLTRLDPPDRITRTINQFITASVEAYCPRDRGKIASIAAYTGRGSPDVVIVLASLTEALPAGEIPPTKPLPVPAAPPPPPPPEELAPAPQQPPPPRHVQQAPQRQQQVEPPPPEAPPQEPPPQAEQPQAPAPAPEPGGGNGGAPAPESPSPAPPAPPGHIRLAP